MSGGSRPWGRRSSSEVGFKPGAASNISFVINLPPEYNKHLNALICTAVFCNVGQGYERHGREKELEHLGYLVQTEIT